MFIPSIWYTHTLLWRVCSNNKVACYQKCLKSPLVHDENTSVSKKMIFNWWATDAEAWFHVDTYEILFGIPNEGNEIIINQLNYVILMAKYYIYCQKQKNKTLDVYEFLLDCKNRLHTTTRNYECCGENGKIPRTMEQAKGLLITHITNWLICHPSPYSH